MDIFENVKSNISMRRGAEAYGVKVNRHKRGLIWEHMVGKHPDLERGQSASETGRSHIPPRLFKQMTNLTKQKEKIDALISDANFFYSKGKIDEVAKLLDKYIPAVAKMDTELKKYRGGYAQLERINHWKNRTNTLQSSWKKNSTKEF